MARSRTRLRLSDAGSASGLLRILLGVSLAVPVMLFSLLAWIEYRNVMEDGRRELERVSDVAREHAEKAFEGQNQVIERINDLLRGLDRDAVRRDEAHLHDAMSHIIAHLTHVQGVAVIDATGAPAASATVYPVAATNLRNTDYFQGVVSGGHPVIARLQTSPLFRTPVFGLAGPWLRADGTLNGVITVGVQPGFFTDFYAALVRQASGREGKIVALVREDGQLLVRYPAPGEPPEQLPRSINFVSALRNAPQAGSYLAHSVVASNPAYRLYSYRKIAGYPLYVVTGLSWDELVREWYPRLMTHLVFGIPATAALFLITRLALHRVQLEQQARTRAEAEIDRRRRAEDVLLRAQRLEAVGQLTGGVAHDFNNLLTIISGNAEMIDRRSGDPAISRLANAIALAARRGGDITQKLLAFSGRQIVHPENVDLNRRLEEFKPLLDRAASEAVIVVLHLDPGLGPVRLDPGQFEAAILNLVGNARDAMPNGGRISIRTRSISLAEANAFDLPPGPHAQVVVTDTGDGMDEATAARAFEPFFTTKEVGRGTGLGLSQVYGFARQARGTARIATAPGRGTTVTLVLPCSRVTPLVMVSPAGTDRVDVPGTGSETGTTAARTEKPRVGAAETGRDTPRARAPQTGTPRGKTQSEASGSETKPLGTEVAAVSRVERWIPAGQVVLVVEDEPSLRETTVSCLESEGYRVLTAQDGPAALRVLRSGARIDILFSDILMPGGMNGIQLARRAREMRPELTLLMTSGASPAAANAPPDDVPLLMKPYDCGELVRQLGLALSRRGLDGGRRR